MKFKKTAKKLSYRNRYKRLSSNDIVENRKTMEMIKLLLVLFTNFSLTKNQVEKLSYQRVCSSFILTAIFNFILMNIDSPEEELVR